MVPHSLPVQQDPELMSGARVFAGTRVPVQTLFDYLVDGYSVSEFLDQFPTVMHDQVMQVLRFCEERVLADVPST